MNGLLGVSRNPFLFRGPIPTPEQVDEWLARGESQSLLIQRSYSYVGGPRFMFSRPRRNPFLFRGPIPTQPSLSARGSWPVCRNPFLFRGPIPTNRIYLKIYKAYVAIPSYSEVLFLPWKGSWEVFCGVRRNPFLFRGPIPTLEWWKK
jgi:hypothetical protein